MRCKAIWPWGTVGRVLLVALLGVLSACASPRARAFERVAVAGASLSAGFALDAEVGRPVALADVLECALTGAHEPVTSTADLFFFMQPREIGTVMAEKALSMRPTLLVAIDFLFWFGYGVVGAEEDRLARLEEGLRLLERFACPIIVGDLPDMSEAIGTMLSAAQVPAPKTRARLNQRIREWATRREVTVVPLAEFVDRLRAGGEILAGTRRYSGAAAGALLQRDRLHPTLEGLACVAVMALESFLGKSTGEYIDDPKLLAGRLRGGRE